jgi:inorganic pyrophosphatase
MDIGAISSGPNPPTDIHAMIEIPLGGAPVKYELDKVLGALMVDRFLHTAMFYPGNYGFIPQTLSADRDPCDVLVVTQVQVQVQVQVQMQVQMQMQVVPGAIVRCRPLGALLMEDEAGQDEKIIAVPVHALAPFYKDVRSYRDLPPMMCEQIAHFFQHYKDLDGQVGHDRQMARRRGGGKAGDGSDRARREKPDTADRRADQSARQWRSPLASAREEMTTALRSRPVARQTRTYLKIA